MDERVVDYLVVAGLPDEDPKVVDEDLCEGLNPNQQNIEPITDITVIFPGLGEYVPRGFECVEHTPSGYPANLNSGSLRSPEVYLCYRRGRDKPPLVDIGVMYDGKERLLPDAEVVLSTPEGRAANVNNTSARTLLTFRRAPDNMPMNELVVTDICVIFQNKAEKPPHAFCLINKNLNKGMMGCDVYLCYKKSMNRPPLLSFKPEVLLRYPPIDRKSFPLPPLTATFCLPMCATIECWPKKSLQPRPVFSTFVLTVADATEKIYGAAITFYEEFSPVQSFTEEQEDALDFKSARAKVEKSLHVNKCVCLLSHHPFFDALKTFLYYLNWMMRSGPHEVPIERYISHLFDEVPFPSPQRPHILMQLSPQQNILLSHSHDSPLPKSGASFRAMLNNLGTENCLMIVLLVLTEQKLLIHSLRPDVLTAVTEAISVLIFPFRWQCPFIPLCPLALCGVLQAPVPFIAGVDSRFFDLYEPPSDVTCIDLDTTTITISEDKKYLINAKLLPKKPTRVLRDALDTIKIVSDNMTLMARATARRGDISEAMDIDFQQKRRERTVELEIQESFLRFMTTILKGYRQYLLPITKAPTIGATDASSLFDSPGFLRSRDKSYHKFYQIMLRTQMFIRFIEVRSFVSENDSCLEFFDECVDKFEADNTETVKLLETTEGNQSERTVFVMPPEPVDLPADTKYSYNCKFNLKEGLFTGLKLRSQSMDRVLHSTDQFTPGSPIARRTKQEIKSSQKVAKKFSEKPNLWAKYLASTCYSIWFIHLPSYVGVVPSKHNALCLAYDMLVRMANCGIQPADEVCYRVVMQLCGLHNQPVIAVKVLLNMKRCGITPNALTYGYYNKAVLEAEWPSNMTNTSQIMWNKLRNVILGVAHFRSGTKQRSTGDTVDESDRVSSGSGISLESHTHQASKIKNHSSIPTLSPPGRKDMANTNMKSQSDSEVANASASSAPTRISSSSDIGYGSMQDQKISSDDVRMDPQITSSERQAAAAKFWGKMGQSLDQWVKSGVSSLASLAADTSYYSQAGVMMGGGGLGYSGDYAFIPKSNQYDEDEDDEGQDKVATNVQIKGKSRRRLDFGDEKEGTEDDKKESQTMRLLRSVSFGNDTQIMSKLKLLRDDEAATDPKKSSPDKENNVTSSTSLTDSQRRSASVESNSSIKLESKVNQYYEPLADSRDTSASKSISTSREVTPDESHETYQETIRPGSLQPPRSPSMQIRTKELSREVTPSSPSRTPVTQDDPLGALSEPCSPDMKNTTEATVKSASLIEAPNRGSPKRTCSEGHIGGICVNNDKVLMGPPPTPKGFHRSSTLPTYGTAVAEPGSVNAARSDEKLTNCIGPTGSSGLAVFSSNLKNPFGRYSPGRLSLRKAGTQLIESTIGGKKAEAFMEGFNQFKSAASVTVKTKLEELKEVVGNNNGTPGRSGPFGSRIDDSTGSEQGDESEMDLTTDQWAQVSESYLDQLLTTEPMSTRASFASVVDYGSTNGIHDSPLSSSRHSLLYVDQLRNAIGGSLNPLSKRTSSVHPVAMEMNMTTLSICHNCSSLLFDEEIMSGWTSEDSNLNTRCPHCKKWEVPFLEVNVVDFRHYPIPQPINTLASAASLESVNMSRRASCINPNSTVPTPQSVQAPKSSPAKQEHNEDITENGNTEASVEIIPELDPLGVLEEIHKSSRTSPDLPTNPTIAEAETSTLSTKDNNENRNNSPNPTISVSTGNDAATGNTGVETQTDADYKLPELEGVQCDPIVVPYLSPLVLRKELENVLENEGDASLTQPTFVDEHPIIYWNMVWFFQRTNLHSHIKGLSLQAKSVLPTKRVKKLQPNKTESSNNDDEAEFEQFSIHASWANVDYRHVAVNCYWDNPKYHDQFTVPLYFEWLAYKAREKREKEAGGEEAEKNLEIDGSLLKLMNNVIRASQGNTLSQTCPQLLFHYHKQTNCRHYPAYRDILFLSIVSGKDSSEAYGYGLDKEYRDVYSKLRNNDDYESMDVGDTPPSDTALCCRRYFRELKLCTPNLN